MKPGMVKVTHDDPVIAPLEEKVVAGPGTQLSVKAGPMGHQLVVHSLAGTDDVARGSVVETSASMTLGSDVSMAIIQASVNLVEITLPHPGEVLGHLTLVCVDNKAGVSLRPMPGTSLFDASNIEFNSPGDALLFASNRKDTWYCISRYTAHFEY
jgi:hypothetical protein